MGHFSLGLQGRKVRMLSVEYQLGSVLVSDVLIVTESEVNLDVDKGSKTRIIHVIHLHFKSALVR